MIYYQIWAMKLTKKNFVLVFLFAIIINMSVETWGQMAKSADDAEKVEQAISRLIAEHEADPSAHLGAGESLEAHRANEIIDHPAGSVVSDKISFNDYILQMPFISLDGFQSGGMVNVIFPQLVMDVDWETPIPSYAVFSAPKLASLNFLNYEFVLRCLTTTQNGIGSNFYQFGIYDNFVYSGSTKIINGFYFSLENRQIFGRFKTASHDYSVFLVNVDELTGPDLWNITYSPVDELLKFYINGELKGSIDLSSVESPVNFSKLGWRAYSPDENSQLSITVDLFYYSLRLVK